MALAEEADLEVQAAVKLVLDVLLQDNAGGGLRLQGDGQRDGFRGAMDVGAQGLLLPSSELRTHSHSENPARRKETANVNQANQPLAAKINDSVSGKG